MCVMPIQKLNVLAVAVFLTMGKNVINILPKKHAAFLFEITCDSVMKIILI